MSSAGQGGWKGYSVELPPGSVPAVSRCSFCGKSSDEVGDRLVRAGTTDTAICEERVRDLTVPTIDATGHRVEALRSADGTQPKMGATSRICGLIQTQDEERSCSASDRHQWLCARRLWRHTRYRKRRPGGSWGDHHPYGIYNDHGAPRKGREYPGLQGTGRNGTRQDSTARATEQGHRARISNRVFLVRTASGDLAERPPPCRGRVLQVLTESPACYQRQHRRRRHRPTRSPENGLVYGLRCHRRGEGTPGSGQCSGVTPERRSGTPAFRRRRLVA